jgi:hypothetical protein
MKLLLTFAILSWLLKADHLLSVDWSSKKDQTPTIQWDSTKNWKLYQLRNFNHVFSIPPDSLQFLKTKPLNDDSMHMFLSRSKKLDGVNPMWQGCYLASYQTANGQIHKAIISHYAGFFFCQSGKVYYQVDSSVQRDWLEYFSDSYINIGDNGK